MRRFALTLVAACALAAGCGGAEEDAPRETRATTGPTSAQLAFRERVLDEIQAGEYRCYCTGALRARDRAEKGDPR
jgi:hypothetical protein